MKRTIQEPQVIRAPKASTWWKSDGAVTLTNLFPCTPWRFGNVSRQEIYVEVTGKSSSSKITGRYVSGTAKTKIPHLIKNGGLTRTPNASIESKILKMCSCQALRVRAQPSSGLMCPALSPPVRIDMRRIQEISLNRVTKERGMLAIVPTTVLMFPEFLRCNSNFNCNKEQSYGGSDG